LSINLQDLIEDLMDKQSNTSDNSFEELELHLRQEQYLEQTDKTEDNNKEYILRVDLNNYNLDMKFVGNVSDNFKNEYLEGIIYLSIENNNYHIFV
jgi:hypothetical protein